MYCNRSGPTPSKPFILRFVYIEDIFVMDKKREKRRKEWRNVPITRKQHSSFKFDFSKFKLTKKQVNREETKLSYTNVVSYYLNKRKINKTKQSAIENRVTRNLDVALFLVVFLHSSFFLTTQKFFLFPQVTKKNRSDLKQNRYTIKLEDCKQKLFFFSNKIPGKKIKQQTNFERITKKKTQQKKKGNHKRIIVVAKNEI
ncbi:hypothetical protein RFI_12698 [Reticulomyxa filosa]|uniref:Uncharacterized protein n=1 Tax=Reticulomyxa filosa TaxID=46433 RepID=X6NFE9_RETFI|nr:hypothetical protein RFI_12698 [Reticulomyxa filosa]|eukprot:ETO24459.1 hypothetical protein RFI_12698 [Reticulomyxa filosa]